MNAIKNKIRMGLPFLFLFLVSSCLESAAQTNNTRPNIIYIMVDDMGYADLSCYGRKDYQTPNLDKLASQGMKFKNAYSAAPVCTPTRAAFMTGRYPARSKVGLLEPWIPVKRDSALGLSAEFPSVARLLKKAGYRTALIGKWHLGILPEFSPRSNGFDYFFGIKTGAVDYISHQGDGGWYDLYLNDSTVYRDGYMTELISQEASNFLKQNHQVPFFLSLQFTAPHWPWQVPGDKAYPDTMRLSAGGSKEIYAAMMKSLDDEIGKILRVLDSTGLSKNTVIIFTSDNGGERYSDMGPFSKRKMTLWEGGVRVPAFVRWPGKIQENSVSEQAVITMDWTATILSLANAKPDKKFPLDGKNLVPLLLGNNKIQERTFYWRTFQRTNQHAVVMGTWKYLKDENGEYLFDLAADPAEKNNLEKKYPDRFEQLKKKYREWENSVLEPLPLVRL